MKKELKSHMNRELNEMRGYDADLRESIKSIRECIQYAESAGAVIGQRLSTEIEEKMRAAKELLRQRDAVKKECESILDADSISRKIVTHEIKLVMSSSELISLGYSLIGLYRERIEAMRPTTD